ncbi:MAG TPA: type II secretion system F family protein [Spirochaetia bacterium]|nr:type II secretion system F family protein [Spirochaetia bacterium]
MFRVRHSDTTGRISESSRSAPSAEALLRDLSSEGLSTLSVRAVSDLDALTDEAAGSRRRCALHALQEFTDGIGTLLKAGLTVQDALAMAAAVFPSLRGRRGVAHRLILDIARQVRSGRSFADSLEVLPVEFPPMYRGLVRIGEHLGTLREVLARLSAYIAGQKSMRNQVSGALVYPSLVLFTAFFGIAVLAWIAIPHMRAMLLASGAAFPAEVDRIIASAKMFVRLEIGIPLCLIGASLVMRMTARRNHRVAMTHDTCVLLLPVIGRAQLAGELVNVTYALDLLTGSGVALPSAIRQAAGVAGNLRIRAALDSVAEQVARGVSPSAAFSAPRLSNHSRRGLFPELFCRWVAIGERIGHAQTAFCQLHTFYRAEVDRNIARLSTLVEPALIVLVGVVLLAAIIVFIVPLFSLFRSLIV